MRILISLVLWLGIMCSARAEHVTGKVTRIYPTGTTVNFWLSTGCKTNSASAYWQFSITSEMGKAWYSMLLTAAATGKPVTVAHSGTCDPGQHQAIWYIFQDF